MKYLFHWKWYGIVSMAIILLFDMNVSAQSTDVIAPTINFNNRQNMTIDLNTIFFDPGVTAIDAVDGDVTDNVVTTGSVNAGAVGSYDITYTIADAAGNVASATRTVTVIDPAPAPVTIDTQTNVQSPTVEPPAPVAPTETVQTVVKTSAPTKKNSITATPITTTVTTKSTPSVQPVVPVENFSGTNSVEPDKKAYSVTNTQYYLNGVLVHTSSDSNEHWHIDNATLKNGTYTLVTSFTYADGSSDSVTNTFTVNNESSSPILKFFGRIFSYLRSLF